MERSASDPIDAPPRVDDQALLRGHRANLERTLVQGAAVALLLLALGGIAQALASWFGQREVAVSQAAVLARSIGGALITLTAALAGWIGWRRGLQTGARVLIMLLLPQLLVLPIWVGSGLYHPAVPALLGLVVVAALLVSPRTALRVLVVAVAGLLVIALAQLQGWIPGAAALGQMPGVSSLLGHLLPLLVGGWLLISYARLQWQTLGSLESSRRMLSQIVKEQQQAAADLRASEARLQQLLDGSLAAVMVFEGSTGEPRFCNPALLKTLGVERFDALRTGWLLPGSPFGGAEALRLLNRTLDEGPQFLPWESQRADGQRIYWQIKTDRIALQGRDCVVVFGHDISDQVRTHQALEQAQARLESEVRDRTRELEQQQRRMQAILEALPLTLAIRDSEGRYQLVNRQFEKSSGWRREQLLGKRSRELMPLAEAEAIESLDAQVLERGGLRQAEQSHVHPQDGLRDLLVTAVAMQDEGGARQLSVLSLGTDVTALKRLQRELRASRDEAERLAAAKSEFLAHMSHEIRTPLNAVLGLAQLALQRPQSESAQRDFQRILESGQHLMGVINDILDFAKFDAGKFSPELQPVRLRALAREALDMVEPRAREKQLPLRLELDAALPELLRLDALRVRQILINLLGNAIKFTAQGEVRLRLGAAGEQLLLAVQDTGPGIDAETQARLFEAFEQGDGSTTRRFGGTGLGLAISRRLARLLGGDLGVDSQPGQGACFTLRLPLLPARPDELPAQALPAAPPAGALAGLRVLAVDDVDINREILAEMLGHLGAAVTLADSGAAALRCAEQQGFDAVLMDVQMPDMDGYQASAALRARWPQLPIWALTAHALPEQRARSLAAGLRGHLTKPVEAQALLQALGALRPAAAMPPPTAARAAEPSPAAAATTSGAWPALPGQDFAAALQRCAGKPALLRKLLLAFLAQYQGAAGALPAGAEPQRAWAHRLKGSAASLGLLSLVPLAQAVESQSPDAAASASGPSAALLAHLAEVLAALERWAAGS